MKKIIIALLSVLLLSVSTYAGVGYAAEGDFYEKHKSEFPEGKYSEAYIELLQKYDSESNTFNCGTFDIYCTANSFQLTMASGLMSFVVKASDILILNPDWIVKEPLFIKYKGYFETLTMSLLSVFLLWQILAGYMKRFTNLEDTGDLLNQKLLATFGGVAFLALYDEIFKIILELQYDISDAILTFGIDEEMFLLVTFKYTPQYSIFFVLFIILIMLVFFVALIYRLVAFAFFYIAGPAAITTIVNEEFNYFNLWLKYIVNNVVTFVLQCLAFSLAVASLSLQMGFLKSMPDGLAIIAGVILALGFCLFALVIPMILGQLGASTGTGRTLGKIVRFAAMRR